MTMSRLQSSSDESKEQIAMGMKMYAERKMPLEELAFLGRIGVEEETDRDALKERGLEVSGRGEEEE